MFISAPLALSIPSTAIPLHLNLAQDPGPRLELLSTVRRGRSFDTCLAPLWFNGAQIWLRTPLASNSRPPFASQGGGGWGMRDGRGWALHHKYANGRVNDTTSFQNQFTNLKAPGNQACEGAVRNDVNGSQWANQANHAPGWKSQGDVQCPLA